MTLDKKKIIISIIIYLAVLSLLLLLFLYPAFKKLEQKSKDLADIKQELDLIHNKIGGISAIKETCSQIESDLERADSFFISKEVPIKIIEFLEDKAVDHEIAIEISSISSRKICDDLWDFTAFRLNLTGSYSNFMNFFNKLETAPFLIEIQDLSIRAVSEADFKSGDYGQLPKDVVKAVLTMRVFTK